MKYLLWLVKSSKNYLEILNFVYCSSPFIFIIFQLKLFHYLVNPLIKLKVNLNIQPDTDAEIDSLSFGFARSKTLWFVGASNLNHFQNYVYWINLSCMRHVYTFYSSMRTKNFFKYFHNNYRNVQIKLYFEMLNLRYFSDVISTSFVQEQIYTKFLLKLILFLVASCFSN